YWAQNQLAHYTDSQIGWIPSVFVFLSLLLGVQFGPLFDRYGPRWINLIASAGYVVCLVLLAECTEYWQFMLTLGVWGGVCCAALSTTGLAVLSHWFRMRRGLANGIAMAGSSCGGVAFPLILRPALDQLGWKWSMRLIALVVLVLTAVANLLIRGRLPVGKRSGAIDPRCLRDSRLAWAAVGTFCLEFTLFGSLGLIPTYAIGQGFSNQTAFIIIAVLNAGSAVGRYASGILADMYGHFNTMGLMIASSIIVIAGVWFSVGHKLAVLYLFAVLFGAFTGGYISLAPSCIGQICTADRFGEVFGTCYCVVSFANLLTIPIGGEVLKAAGSEVLIGVMVLSAGIALVSFSMARWACLDYKWKWAIKI
ncbi:MFS general substrate transporter, partial [Viridothelium virens]